VSSKVWTCRKAKEAAEKKEREDKTRRLEQMRAKAAHNHGHMPKPPQVWIIFSFGWSCAAVQCLNVQDLVSGFIAGHSDLMQKSRNAGSLES
jgi:hypothetical protein